MMCNWRNIGIDLCKKSNIKSQLWRTWSIFLQEMKKKKKKQLPRNLSIMKNNLESKLKQNNLDMKDFNKMRDQFKIKRISYHLEKLHLIWDIFSKNTHQKQEGMKEMKEKKGKKGKEFKDKDSLKRGMLKFGRKNL